jgi:hypothetical protein
MDGLIELQKARGHDSHQTNEKKETGKVGKRRGLNKNTRVRRED